MNTSALRRMLRLLTLLRCAEEAGITPIRVLAIHALAYLADVLAPVWNVPGSNGETSVMKQLTGPFFPVLQQDLDLMVGRGLVVIRGTKIVEPQPGVFRIDGEYTLNHQITDRILARLMLFKEERHLRSYISELALAMSALSESELESAIKEDMTYADPRVSSGNLLDLGGEDGGLNASIATIRRFDQFAPKGTTLSPGEKLHIYVRLVRDRFLNTSSWGQNGA